MRRTHQSPAASDVELIARARSGDNQAFAELYRRHRKAAVSTARWLLPARADADDVVADAFAGVLAAIQNGNGPRDDFRPYLLAAVRNGCRLRRQRFLDAEDRRHHRVRAAPMFEDPERYVEADTVARAFATLNPRWQQTLWLTEVEQRSTTEVGERLQLAPNAAAALTHRAREAFATAYLAEHVTAPADESCRRYADRLAAYIRGQLTDSQRTDVEAHLAVCAPCARAVDDLRDLNASLRTLVPVAPASLAVPLTVGTTMGAASTGLFTSGLLIKGMAALLLVAPVVVVGVNSVRNADSSEATPEQTVLSESTTSAVPTTGAVATAPATTAAPTSTSVAPTSTERATPPSTAPASTTPAPTAPTTTVAAVGAGISVGPGRTLHPSSPTVDEVVARLDPLVEDVVLPLVEDVVTTVVDIVEPLLDNVLVPAVGLIGLIGNVDDVIADGLSLTVPSLPLPDVVSIAPTTTTPADDAAVTTVAAIPAATTPAASVPTVTVGPVTLPPVTVPPITLVPTTLAQVTLPPVTLPPVTLPPVTLPPVTVTIPPIVPTTLLDLLDRG